MCVCVCVTNEKKVPDVWQARQATQAILQVSNSKHNAKKITTRVRGPFHQSITAILTEEKREEKQFREHLISSQFFSKRNAFQIGFTPLPPPFIRKAYRTFSDNNRCRPSSRPRLSMTKLIRASLLSFSSREASADNIISTFSSFSPFPVSLHESSALRLASTRGRPGLQAT